MRPAIATTLHTGLLLAVLCCDLTAANAGENESIAVMPLVARRVDEEIVRVFDDFIAMEIGRIGSYDVIAAADINAMLGVEMLKDAMGCDQLACAAEIGGALNTRYVLTGTVSKLADQLLIRLVLFDNQKAEIVNQVSEQVQAEESLYENAVLTAVWKLVGKSEEQEADSSDAPPPNPKADGGVATSPREEPASDQDSKKPETGDEKSNEPGRGRLHAVTAAYQYLSLPDVLSSHELRVRANVELGINVWVSAQMSWPTVDQALRERIDSALGATAGQSDAPLTHTIVSGQVAFPVSREPIGLYVYGGTELVMLANSKANEATGRVGLRTSLDLFDAFGTWVSADYSYTKDWQRVRWPTGASFALLPSREQLTVETSPLHLATFRLLLSYQLFEEIFPLSTRIDCYYLMPLQANEVVLPDGSSDTIERGWVAEASVITRLTWLGLGSSAPTIVGGIRFLDLKAPYDLGRVPGDAASENTPSVGWFFEAGWWFRFE